MLASITPLGERGRHMPWAITVVAFLTGATAAGALAGAGLGAAGGWLIPLAAGPGPRLLTLSVALALVIAFELRAAPVPGPRRQVNERWLDQYRGWVYGLGYGVQLGAGVTTIVTSAATYVALLAAFLVAGVGPGALIVGVYGAIRGLTPLVAVGVRSPEQLLALHARLHRARAPVARAGLLALVLALGLGLAGSGW